MVAGLGFQGTLGFGVVQFLASRGYSPGWRVSGFELGQLLSRFVGQEFQGLVLRVQVLKCCWDVKTVLRENEPY